MMNFNGELLDPSTPVFRANDRAFAYGDSVFESFRFSEGQIHFLIDHYFRLMSAMRIFRMKIPMHFTPEFFEEQVQKMISEDSSNQSWRVRLSVYRQGEGRYQPETNEVGCLATAEPMGRMEYELGTGLKLDVFKDHLKPIHLLSSFKNANSSLYVIAANWLKENNLDECFLLNEKKQVCEAVSSNVFLVKENDLITPPLQSGCVKGIMRKQFLKMAPMIGLKPVEKDLSPFDLLKADEIWLSNSIKGIRSVKKYKLSEYSNERALDMLEALNAQFS